MKTKITITTISLLLFFVVAGVASTPTLTFYGIKGAVIEIPVKLEEAMDSIPCEITESFNNMKKEERKTLVNRQFDLRNMSKPEAGVDDIVPAVL